MTALQIAMIEIERSSIEISQIIENAHENAYRMKQFYEVYARERKSDTTGDTIELDKSSSGHIKQ